MDSTYNIYIKNMVCDRCIMVVTDILKKLGLNPVHVVLGRAELSAPLTDAQRTELKDMLTSYGFELIEDSRTRTVEQIKQLIIELIHGNGNQLQTNLSQYLSDACHHDYSALSKLFSEVQGTTIEKYFIAQKIERAKELLEYDELNLNEIALALNYSSAAHLSAQFKTYTGLTPRQYKQQKVGSRIPLNKI